MNVEVNETNIDLFALPELTGNTREELLSRAAEAAEAGYVLTVALPDSLLRQNVFEVAQSTPVPQEDQGLFLGIPCSYTLTKGRTGLPVWLCTVHNTTSKHDVALRPSAPCLAVETDTETVTENGESIYKRPPGYDNV